MTTLYLIVRNRGDLYKNITPDYYGYRDDDDGVLIEKEKRAEVEYYVLLADTQRR